MTGKTYRPCIVGVIINDEGKLLVGKRKNYNGGWQFPQGGVDEGESFEEALHREMKEELGISSLRILKSSQDLHRYDFPSELHAPIAKKFRGQEQKWFLCQLIPPAYPDLEKATDEEFSEIAWMFPKELMTHTIFWKIQVYRDALTEFGFDMGSDHA